MKNSIFWEIQQQYQTQLQEINWFSAVFIWMVTPLNSSEFESYSYNHTEERFKQHHVKILINSFILNSV